MASTLGSAFHIVRRELLLLEIPGLDAERIEPGSLLVEDVGLDSLRLADLTVRLEDALGIREFPMQEWIDFQRDGGLPLSVGQLAAACEKLMHVEPWEAPQ